VRPAKHDQPQSGGLFLQGDNGHTKLRARRVIKPELLMLIEMTAMTYGRAHTRRIGLRDQMGGVRGLQKLSFPICASSRTASKFLSQDIY
jgi:hypothetical protein